MDGNGTLLEQDDWLNRTHVLNDSTDVIPEQIFYSKPYSVVSMLLYAVIFVFGLVGNTMVVCVILRSKSMHTATNCYLLSLAISDSLILISATLPAIAEPLFQIKEWPWGPVMCSMLVFLQYLGINASTLSIAAFTIERYIAICHPLKARVICSVARAKRVMICLWITSIAYCSPWIGLTYTFDLTSGGKVIEVCYFRLKRNQYLAYYLTDLVLLYVIPLIMAAGMYGCIGRALFKTISHDTGYLLERRRQGTITSHGSSAKHNSRTNSVQVVRMLIVIVSVFAIAWLPYRSLVVYNSLSSSPFLNQWYLLFCRCLIYTNSAINPILYNAMSKKFRREFKNILCCKSKRSSPKQTSKPTVDSPTKHKLGEKTSVNGVATHQSLKENDSSTNSQVAETKLLLCHSICGQTTDNRG